MIRVPVALGERSHEVVVGSRLLSRVGELGALPAADRAFVVTDRAVADTWYESLATGLSAVGIGAVLLPVPVGEGAKSLATAEALFRQLAVQEAHRDDLIVGLGGGVVTDLGGFVAATYMRGLAFLAAPTTLTGQVDAAVGGKTGLNLPEGKNLVGAIHQPVAVVCDVSTLQTLPDREFRSGLAEVAKYGLCADTDILELLERNPAPVVSRDPEVMEDLVARCVRAKARIVARDERDAGERMVLNYGHTLGHALERLDDFGGRTHGEAVSLGMVFAAHLAELTGTAPSGLVSRHLRLLSALGLPTDGPVPSADAILGAMRLDKKYRHGTRFVLLEGVGRPKVVTGVPEDRVRAALEAVGVGGGAGA